MSSALRALGAARAGALHLFLHGGDQAGAAPGQRQHQGERRRQALLRKQRAAAPSAQHHLMHLQLQMYGYDISWAAFNIVEVMASTKYTEKRIGYWAASQSFHVSPPLLTEHHRRLLTAAGAH